MNQLIFDFEDRNYPGFDKFLGHTNAELIYVLQYQADPFIFVWGEAGSGKSHLLKAWVAQAQSRGLKAKYVDASREGLGNWLFDLDCVAIDQIELLSATEQQQLFALFNHFRNSRHGNLLLSSAIPPQQLMIREDLRTRMAFCLVYEIKPLSEEEKFNALVGMAKARQIPIDDEVIRYLLSHWRRDLDSLLLMLNTLNDYSLAQGKRITLTLLRQLLKQQENA
ncbi:MAG: DnaA regulatory inactivator Hda [Snodgrassella sp.]|nr:DnaA regulatory inactivator Hda [Snodgrassella sp.]